MIEFKTSGTPEIMFAANGDLKVIFTAPRIYAKQFDTLPKDKDLMVQVKEYRKKRSLDANAYFWVLCDKVAEAVGSSKEEIYLKKVRKYGVWKDYAIAEEEADEEMEMWAKIGIGWFCERFVNCKIDKCAKIRKYYGSSIYNSKQMWRLINSIIDDCHELGIPTMTNKEIERLCEAYNIE